MIILPEDYVMDRWCTEPSPFAIRPLPTMFSPDVAIDAMHGPLTKLDFVGFDDWYGPRTDFDIKVPKESIARDLSGQVAIRVDTGTYMTPEAYKAMKDWIDNIDDLHKEKMQHVKPSKELADKKHWLNLRKR